MIKFSIVTILYNSKDLISDTMKSILYQEYPYIEYILVDGNSSDGSQKIIEDFIPRLTEKGIDVIYSSEPDKGISDAFNKGISKSTGDVIALINSGDGLLPGTLKNVANAWKIDDEIVYGKTLAIDKKNNLKYLREIPDNIDLSKMIYNGLIFTHQSAFVKRAVYEKYGTYNVSFKYIMDDELFLKFYKNGVRFRYIDEVVVSMLYGGVSSKSSKGMLKEKLVLSKEYHGEAKGILYLKYYMSKPKEIAKSIMRKFPMVWYRFVGEKRRVSNDDYSW